MTVTESERRSKGTARGGAEYFLRGAPLRNGMEGMKGRFWGADTEEEEVGRVG
jgi:hypothetical protein